MIEELKSFIDDILLSGAYKLVLSNPKGGEFKKVTLSMLNGVFEIEKLTEKQAFHSRISASDAPRVILDLMENFKQLNAWSDAQEWSARFTSKGKLLTHTKSVGSSAPEKRAAHDREKVYRLADGIAVPALVDVGVMSADGHVLKSMADKYKQINRFLELIDDSTGSVKSGDTLSVVDFGCGKSYLTFVLYHYLKNVRGINVKLTGIDLKADVIAHCNALSEKYGYSDLRFVACDIKDFDPSGGVDMVVSLHACDTATDLVLFNAIRWGARFIFSAPCCQHELNLQLNKNSVPLLSEYGIIKERYCTLLTDSLRAKLLTAYGYRTQLLEFVELTHTPKNLLIRAEKVALPRETRLEAYEAAHLSLSSLSVTQTLCRLTDESFPRP